ncbi:hypothetical protein SESBI_31449 [Sesbania bispinosa]|nr:hypothetical protein SESBI_31449 [Sesbania bispinosa]
MREARSPFKPLRPPLLCHCKARLRNLAQPTATINARLSLFFTSSASFVLKPLSSDSSDLRPNDAVFRLQNSYRYQWRLERESAPLSKGLDVEVMKLAPTEQSAGDGIDDGGN